MTIGEGAQIGAQSGVMCDVPPGERWVGTPAKPVAQWFRDMMDGGSGSNEDGAARDRDSAPPIMLRTERGR